MRISDWSSDVCSSDLHEPRCFLPRGPGDNFGAYRSGSGDSQQPFLTSRQGGGNRRGRSACAKQARGHIQTVQRRGDDLYIVKLVMDGQLPIKEIEIKPDRSEEHTSELQSIMRISYAVFCLKKKKNNIYTQKQIQTILNN